MSTLTKWTEQGITFFYGLTHNYGLAIILFTLAIGLVLLPFRIKQMASMFGMQAMEPERKALEKKYKNDPVRLNQETMALWKKYNVNPFFGCLVMVIQLPLLWALYRALANYPYVGATNFLWLPALQEPDPYYILPVLAAVTTYWQSKVTMTSNDQSQRMMLYMLPIFIGFISLKLAAGLSIYWIFSNLTFAVQGYLTPRPKVAKGETSK